MIDKAYCMSSYLALRYIENKDADFLPGIHHKCIDPIPESEKIGVLTSNDIDHAIADQLQVYKDKKMGLLLSGGMDSGILASYLKGCDAYTFRFLGGNYQHEELERAEYYAKQYKLTLHYVDISWETVEKYVDKCMQVKAAPVHSIEPQILQAALQAKTDGVEIMLTGESSDLVFGGMNELLAKDWTVKEFAQRYTFTNPELVLNNVYPMYYIFERYGKADGKIDFLKFMDEIFSVESASSYFNAFSVADMPYFDPYARLKMSSPLNLYRIRHGESKYLIRELMTQKYPHIPVPNKLPMPRPVDIYFENWEGPTRPEFKAHLNMSDFTGNQKWQIYCLERFLNMYDPLNGQRSLCK